MIIKTLIFFHIFVASDLQDISNRLADEKYKVRQGAMAEAKALSSKEKTALINILKKSNDPEKTESAKIISSTLSEHNSFDKMSKLITDQKNKDFINAVSISPSVLKLKKGQFNLLDIALSSKNKEIEKFLKSKGLKSKLVAGLKTMDVLIVKTDTWKSLAKDFLTTEDLIKMVNPGKKVLNPGDIIKIPRK